MEFPWQAFPEDAVFVKVAPLPAGVDPGDIDWFSFEMDNGLAPGKWKARRLDADLAFRATNPVPMAPEGSSREAVLAAVRARNAWIETNLRWHVMMAAEGPDNPVFKKLRFIPLDTAKRGRVNLRKVIADHGLPAEALGRSVLMVNRGDGKGDCLCVPEQVPASYEPPVLYPIRVHYARAHPKLPDRPPEVMWLEEPPTAADLIAMRAALGAERIEVV